MAYFLTEASREEATESISPSAPSFSISPAIAIPDSAFLLPSFVWALVQSIPLIPVLITQKMSGVPVPAKLKLDGQR
ncbi:MAG: hypothetical protein QOH41_1480 [Blastocatellia bacterium]|nr:hypothetical protein [Blastocatellia bacterium]